MEGGDSTEPNKTKGNHISGSVSFLDGSTPSDLAIIAYSNDALGGAEELGRSVVDDLGRFTMELPKSHEGGPVYFKQSRDWGQAPSFRLGQDERRFYPPWSAKIRLHLPGGQLPILVLDESGNPVESAAVTCIFGDYDDVLMGGPNNFLLTSSQGIAVLDHSGIGYVTVHARMSDGVRTALARVFPLTSGRPTEPVVVTLDQLHACSLDISIVDQYGVSVRPVAVRLSPDFDSVSSARYITVVNGPGDIIVNGLDPGQYKVSVKKVLSGGVSLYKQSNVDSLEVGIASGHQRVTIAVEVHSGMRLNVSGLTGEGARVELNNGIGGWFRTKSLVLLDSEKIATFSVLREDGSYGLGGLDSGNYAVRLVFVDSGDVIAVREGVELIPGKLTEIAIDCEGE